jgi:hypothetical protein
MKKLIYTFLLFASGMLSAQKSNIVKFAVYNDAIGTVKMFDNHKSNIEKVNFYKTKASLPSHLKKFEYLADNGLTEIKLKKNAGNPDSLSLELLNKQGNVPTTSPVFIDGYKIEGPDTRIYSEMIENIEVKEYNGQNALYISTTKS